MEHFGGGGNWGMIPNIQSHSNPTTPSSQDHLFLQQQQFNQQQQFQQQFIQSPQQSQPRFQQQPQQQQQQQQQPQQPQNHQSLASHFHLLHLVENLAEVTENGTRDQQTDALIAELSSQFEKCQQLLNSIGGTIKAKSTTVGEQKRRLEETENLLAQRRDLISNYRSSVEELINTQI
ncbi:mediator of RNA polymerase ii transcription subunit 9 [Phtheirospermum japonicum]|uniref:Mediator of RNA polymerase ii transcription subunit 9 n=1 Tax=Phtheirospermum japonicum TaxID=374723 RepID=A0A830D1J8_9LAMI|nr:mediator of RNA polymerase ii transcription subunit 9 [Phtheirospermum japonicum]